MIDSERIEAIEDAGRYVCRRCQGRLRSLEFDSEHEDCEPRVDEARAREARKNGHLDTARLLHRLGFDGQAEWHERAAQGRW